MKTSIVLLGGMLTMGTVTEAVEIGDSPAAVRAELGEPSGQLMIGNRILFTYDRGEVEFQTGRVVRCELVSPEEAEKRRLALAADQDRQMQWATTQYEARIARGQAALGAARADPSFDLRSASDQVSFWRSFRMQYPEVPVDREYAQALRRLDVEQLEQRAAAAEERRIAHLEARLEDAEDRLRRAESRSLYPTVSYDGYYGLRSYAVPVVYSVPVVRRSCRPPPCLPIRPVCATPSLSLTVRGGSSLIRGHTTLVRN